MKLVLVGDLMRCADIKKCVRIAELVLRILSQRRSESKHNREDTWEREGRRSESMQLVEFILLGASMPELLVKLKLKLLRKIF